MRSSSRALWVLVLCGWSFCLQALESDAAQPIYVEADGVEIDEKSGTSTYQGNVILTQGTIRITADKIAVVQGEKKAHNQIVADGDPVTFKQDASGTEGGKLVRGRAKRVEYRMNSEILYMSGDAELVQGKDTFSSDRIVYDRTRAVVKAGTAAKGKQRVRISIQPTRSD